MAAAVSVAMLGSIAVTATSASAGEGKVWVCHATSSDSNPYRIINVSLSSAKYEGHHKHATNPNKTWDKDGSFGGYSHTAGQEKPDIIEEGLNPPAKCFNTDLHAKLKLVKNLGGDGPAVVTDWELFATGATEFSGDGGFDSTSVPTGSYTLSESDGPDHYNAGHWSCTGTQGLNGHTLILAAGDVATCEITNTYDSRPEPDMATLTLVKVVEGSGGADATAWTLKAGTVISGSTGTGAATGLVAAGTYGLSESGPTVGYTAGLWGCTGNSVSGQLGSQSVTMSATPVTCTITNTYAPTTPVLAKLTLVKKVLKSDVSPSRWTLHAVSDGKSFEGTTGTDGVGVTDGVPAGTYTLSETGGPSDGFTTDGFTCLGANMDGSYKVIIAPEDKAVTCTIINTWSSTSTPAGPVTTPPTDSARITLSATVNNHFGGTAKVSDFTLTATGQLAPAAAAQNSFSPLAVSGTPPISFSGITLDADITNAAVPAGTYALSVSALPQGYSKSAWVCTGGEQSGSEFTVRLGQSVSCNISILDGAASVIPPVVTPVVAGKVVTLQPAKVPTKVVKGAVVPKAPVVAPNKVTQLAFTGAETVPLGLSGLLALLLGVGLILVSRRRATD
jgi:hypothetical protein